MRSCAAANWCCVATTTEEFQRFPAIQTNNESLLSVLAIANLTLSVAIILMLATRFIHCTSGTLQGLTAVTINVRPGSSFDEFIARTTQAFRSSSVS